jgi:hypothetical protein
MGITLRDLEKSMDEELHQYRLKLFETCLETETQRGTQSFWHYAFPEEPLIHQDTSYLNQRQRFGLQNSKISVMFVFSR